MNAKDIIPKAELIKRIDEIMEDFVDKKKRARTNQSKRGIMATLKFFSSINHHLKHSP